MVVMSAAASLPPAEVPVLSAPARSDMNSAQPTFQLMVTVPTPIRFCKRSQGSTECLPNRRVFEIHGFQVGVQLSAGTETKACVDVSVRAAIELPRRPRRRRKRRRTPAQKKLNKKQRLARHIPGVKSSSDDKKDDSGEGEKQKKTESDEQGKEGKPGKNGKDGKDGKGGKDGKDGKDEKEGKDGKDGDKEKSTEKSEKSEKGVVTRSVLRSIGLFRRSKRGRKGSTQQELDPKSTLLELSSAVPEHTTEERTEVALEGSKSDGAHNSTNSTGGPKQPKRWPVDRLSVYAEGQMCTEATSGLTLSLRGGMDGVWHPGGLRWLRVEKLGLGATISTAAAAVQLGIPLESECRILHERLSTAADGPSCRRRPPRRGLHRYHQTGCQGARKLGQASGPGAGGTNSERPFFRAHPMGRFQRCPPCLGCPNLSHRSAKCWERLAGGCRPSAREPRALPRA